MFALRTLNVQDATKNITDVHKHQPLSGEHAIAAPVADFNSFLAKAHNLDAALQIDWTARGTKPGPWLRWGSAADQRRWGDSTSTSLSAALSTASTTPSRSGLQQASSMTSSKLSRRWR